MAFLLNKSISSPFRSQSHLPMKTQHDAALSIPRRGFHVEPGLREQALLAEDLAIKRYKSHKKGVQILKTFGDVLTIVVVAGCCYEIYVRAVTREQSQKQREEVQN